jgi:hypothetical protein
LPNGVEPKIARFKGVYRFSLVGEIKAQSNSFSHSYMQIGDNNFAVKRIRKNRGFHIKGDFNFSMNLEAYPINQLNFLYVLGNL